MGPAARAVPVGPLVMVAPAPRARSRAGAMAPVEPVGAAATRAWVALAAPAGPDRLRATAARTGPLPRPAATAAVVAVEPTPSAPVATVVSAAPVVMAGCMATAGTVVPVGTDTPAQVAFRRS